MERRRRRKRNAQRTVLCASVQLLRRRTRRVVVTFETAPNTFISIGFYARKWNVFTKRVSTVSFTKKKKKNQRKQKTSTLIKNENILVSIHCPLVVRIFTHRRVIARVVQTAMRNSRAQQSLCDWHNLCNSFTDTSIIDTDVQSVKNILFRFLLLF